MVALQTLGAEGVGRVKFIIYMYKVGKEMAPRQSHSSAQSVMMSSSTPQSS